MLRPMLHGMRNHELQSKLSWAAHEAASLAWMTPIPLLVFPALFEEKVGSARKQWMMQQRIRRQPQPLALAA